MNKPLQSQAKKQEQIFFYEKYKGEKRGAFGPAQRGWVEFILFRL